MKSRRRLDRPARKVLEEIATGLEEIESHFALEAFSANDVEQAGEQAPTDEPGLNRNSADEESHDGDYDDDEESSGGTEVFNREDIEVAIDEFISHLVRAGLVEKSKAGLLSFSEVFELFFGEDHVIADIARTFEDHITGYFGSIAYEDMRTAYEEFSEIKATTTN